MSKHVLLILFNVRSVINNGKLRRTSEVRTKAAHRLVKLAKQNNILFKYQNIYYKNNLIYSHGVFSRFSYSLTNEADTFFYETLVEVNAHLNTFMHRTHKQDILKTTDARHRTNISLTNH